MSGLFFFRLYTEELAFERSEFFPQNTSSVPEEVSSLSAGLLDTVRAYHAANHKRDSLKVSWDSHIENTDNHNLVIQSISDFFPITSVKTE